MVQPNLYNCYYDHNYEISFLDENESTVGKHNILLHLLQNVTSVEKFQFKNKVISQIYAIAQYTDTIWYAIRKFDPDKDIFYLKKSAKEIKSIFGDKIKRDLENINYYIEEISQLEKIIITKKENPEDDKDALGIQNIDSTRMGDPFVDDSSVKTINNSIKEEVSKVLELKQNLIKEKQEKTNSKISEKKKRTVIGKAATQIIADKTIKATAVVVGKLSRKIIEKNLDDPDQAILAEELIQSDIGQGIVGYPTSLILPKLLPVSKDKKNELKEAIQISSFKKIGENILNPLGEWILSELKNSNLSSISKNRFADLKELNNSSNSLPDSEEELEIKSNIKNIK